MSEVRRPCDGRTEVLHWMRSFPAGRGFRNSVGRSRGCASTSAERRRISGEMPQVRHGNSGGVEVLHRMRRVLGGPSRYSGGAGRAFAAGWRSTTTRRRRRQVPQMRGRNTVRTQVLYRMWTARRGGRAGGCSSTCTNNSSGAHREMSDVLVTSARRDRYVYRLRSTGPVRYGCRAGASAPIQTASPCQPSSPCRWRRVYEVRRAGFCRAEVLQCVRTTGGHSFTTSGSRLADGGAAPPPSTSSKDS